MKAILFTIIFITLLASASARTYNECVDDCRIQGGELSMCMGICLDGG